MKPLRLVVIACAWLLTAAAAFSLGRVSSIKQMLAPAAPALPAAAPVPSAAVKATDESHGVATGGLFGSTATGLAEILGSRSLEEHVKHLLKQDDEAVRMLGFLRLIEALNTADEIKAVLDVIAKDGRGGFRMTEQAMLLQKWAKLSPEDAAAYANGQRDWAKFNGLNAVLKTWVKSSPEEAIAWAEKNGAPQSNDAQPGRGPGEDGNWAVATLISSLAKSNLERAMQVAENQPYSRARGRMADTLVSELIAQRGEDAARDAVLAISDEQFRAGMARELAQRMANKDPKATAAWANGLPAGETRERAMAEAIQEWANKDAVGAGQYLQQLGASPEFDRARQEYAMRVVRTDPEGALAWTQAITDEKRRTDTTQEVLSSWARRDQQAAQTWAQTNGVQIQPRGGGPGFGGPSFGRGRR